MSITTANVNTGGAGDLKKFFSSEVIRQWAQTTYFKQFAKMRTLEKGSHVYVETVFGKANVTLDTLLAASEDSWVEITNNVTNVEIPVIELPVSHKITRKANAELHFNIHLEASFELARTIGELTDEYIQRQINDETSGIAEASAQRIFSGNATERAEVGAGDTLSALSFIDAFAKLKDEKAPVFADGKYVAIVSTKISASLKKESGNGTFVDVNKYTNAMPIYNGEIGSLYGVRIVESANVKAYEGEGALGVDVYPTYVLAMDSYVFVSGDELETMIKMPGDTSTDNPVNKFSTVGVYARFGAKVIKKNGIVIIESAVV